MKSNNVTKTITGKHSNKLGVQEARIERDDDGNVVRVVYGRLEHDSSDEEEFAGFEDTEEDKTEVVKELERLASLPVVSKPRVQSEREQYWIEELYNKHGDDYDAMMWDKKLNLYQQSAGDIKRRVKKWKKVNNIE